MYSHRESVLLGYGPQRSFIQYPSSSPKSPCRNSDVDFSDVFGGPPRRSSMQEMQYSFGETRDSCSFGNKDETVSFRSRLLGLDEKPVFGDEGANRRRYPSEDFFDDIFRGNESLSSSPRKLNRDPFSSTPGSRVLSPVRPLPPRAEPFLSSSLPAQFSLPAKLIKGTDLQTFGSSSRNHHKNKDGTSNGLSYPYSSLSRSSSQANQLQDELNNDVCCQSSLSQELSLSSKETSDLIKADETDKDINLKRDSKSFEVLTNGSQFHFSIYKWASKGVPLAMPFRGGSSSRLKDKCKFVRCSSTNGRIACEGMARVSPTVTPQDIDLPPFNSSISSDPKSFGTELDKEENGFLLDASTQDGIEQCQIVEETILLKTVSETANSHQVIFKDVPDNTIFQDLREQTKSHSALDTVLSEQSKEEISVITQDATKRELKPPRPLFFDNNYDQGFDEKIRRNQFKESKVKSTKKSSAVFDVTENLEKQDGKGTTMISEAVDKANLQQDNLGKNRVGSKVKEFVKIFNQEASNKPKSDVDSQSKSFRHNRRGKFMMGDEARFTTTKINEKMHMPKVNKDNLPDASFTSHKQHPETRANNYKSTAMSSGLKDSSASTAVSTPGGSEPVVGDTDESFEGNLLIKELPQDEDKLPQTGKKHEELQVIDAKIRKWSNGKEGNIRSLLSTLQYILWYESGWKPVPLVDIVEGTAVKRTYQKALLCLHPDKLQQKGASSTQKYIAEKVFDILQEAWTHFNLLGSL